MFVDKVTVMIKAGQGGNGCVSMRQEKYVDKGGPDGGNGGKGGDVVFVGSDSQNTLSTFRYDKFISAENGDAGFSQKKAGRGAKPLQVEVPVGTVVTLLDGTILADITYSGQETIVARGGLGGYGNAHFVSSVRQAPRVAERGEPGEEFEAILELKMIADVGLVGLPNAGKSTLLSVVSNAKPEIANYPFTTLVPNLGVAEVDETHTLLIADIPGLIEGASEGKGLGDEFLRHIERTKAIAHLIDAYSNDPAADYLTIRGELTKYSENLAGKPELIIITKTEGLDDDIVKSQIDQVLAVAPKGTKILSISAVAHKGLKEVLYALLAITEIERAKVTEVEENTIPVIKLQEDVNAWQIVKSGDHKFIVSGRKIERFVIRIDIEDEEGERRIRDIMRKMGIMRELRRLGIEAEDMIQIGKVSKGEFEF